MRFYKRTGRAEYGEAPGEDMRTGERVTFTDARQVLNSGDYVTVRAWDAVTDDSACYDAFQFLIMTDGATLNRYICDAETAEKVIAERLHDLLLGTVNTRELAAALEQMQTEYMNSRND